MTVVFPEYNNEAVMRVMHIVVCITFFWRDITVTVPYAQK